MRTLAYILPGLAIVAMSFWAYSENYETQKSLARVQQLQRDIGGQRETLAILKAEWAYLNRPERLRELAIMNFDQLELLPLSSEHFADAEEIPFPPPEIGPLSAPIPLMSEARP